MNCSMDFFVLRTISKIYRLKGSYFDYNDHQYSKNNQKYNTNKNIIYKDTKTSYWIHIDKEFNKVNILTKPKNIDSWNGI